MRVGGYPPIGYRYEKVAGHGKLLVRNEPLASIIAEALEGYASGRFETATEVALFLETQPAYPRDGNGEVHVGRIDEIFGRAVYAGYIDLPEWGLNLVPAKHEPLVSLATWQAVRDRRNGIVKAPVRKDINDDFPLRGFVACACCGKPMTACWSKGRSARYPYYLCDTRGCPERRKSFRKEKLEGEFETLLLGLKLSEGMFHLAFAVFRDLWNAKAETAQAQSVSLKADIRAIEKKIEQLLDRVVSMPPATPSSRPMRSASAIWRCRRR